MGQIANQMALKIFFKIKERIKEKKKQKQDNKNNGSKKQTTSSFMSWLILGHLFLRFIMILAKGVSKTKTG